MSPQAGSTAIARAADPGQALSFCDAILPYLDDAYSLARYLLGNTTDAEDAVQECYLLAHRHFDRVRGPNLRPWLLSILRNVCYSEFRRRTRRETPADFTGGDSTPEEAIWQQPSLSPEDIILRRLDAATVRHILDELPAPFREILVLREVNELAYAEIADVIGKPVGTVMSRLARAREKFRTAWTSADATAEFPQFHPSPDTKASYNTGL